MRTGNKLHVVKLKINADAIGDGTLLLDGQDISRNVSRILIEINPQTALSSIQLTVVNIELDAEIEGALEARFEATDELERILRSRLMQLIGDK